MKVIIVKNCKDGNVNDVIEVSSGYGTNYLIKNGFAEPINKVTNLKLESRLKNNQELFAKKSQEAMELKNKLENLELIFELKMTNMVIHGSITTKKVNQRLKELGFELSKHAVPHVHIESLGVTNIKVKLFDKIEAIVKVMVNKGE